jgi:hypothetical protein
VTRARRTGQGKQPLLALSRIALRSGTRPAAVILALTFAALATALVVDLPATEALVAFTLLTFPTTFAVALLLLRESAALAARLQWRMRVSIMAATSGPSSLDGARRTLTQLGRQYRGGRLSKEGFTPLIDVIGDAGRALGDPPAPDLRDFLASLANLREQLEYHGRVERSPWQALTHDKSEEFAAGSLWACSAMINSWLRHRLAEEEREQGRADRRTLRGLVLELAERHAETRPGDVLAACEERGLETSRSLVSKAISDLLSRGVLEPVEGPGLDRRHRYYRRADDGESIPEDVRHRFERSVASLLEFASKDEAEQYFHDAVDERLN